jgi:hypothetical protein
MGVDDTPADAELATVEACGSVESGEPAATTTPPPITIAVASPAAVRLNTFDLLTFRFKA